MNEKFKIFFAGICSAFALIGSIILAILCRKNRQRTDTDVGTRIEDAGTTCESAKGTAEQLTETTESAIRTEQDIERTTEQLADSIDTSKQILAELRKRQSEK